MREKIRGEMVSQLAWRSEVWTVAAEETEYCKKKTVEPSAKKRSRRRGRREEGESKRKRKTERRRKRKRTATDWREVKRWTGVWPLTSGSDSADKRSW